MGLELLRAEEASMGIREIKAKRKREREREREREMCKMNVTSLS